MSFAESVKTELTGQGHKKTCCRKAFVFGLLLNSGVSDDGVISFESEHEGVFSSALSAFSEQFGKKPETSEYSRFGNVRRRLSFSARSAAEILSLLDSGSAISEAVGFRCDECRVNFLRGVFMASATVSDPLKSYHLEFLIKNAIRAKLLYSVLRECGFEAKISNRRLGIGLYFKESEAIEDILTYLGASKMLFECMNDKILREIRNDTNRKANCETGNIAKAVGASQDIIAAIRKIEGAGLLSALPDDLRNSARLREEHPEASLSELCHMFSPPLSKSGLNHRFTKIKKIAEDIGKN